MKPQRVDIHDVERRVDRIRLRYPFGFIGVHTKVHELLETGRGVRATVSGAITMHQWDMDLGINTRWVPEQDTNIAEYLQARGIRERGVYVVADDATRHEFGHPRYCPISLESYTLIKNAVAEQLQSMGINSKEATDYLSNAFMDLIDNANVRKSGHGEGLTIFYYTQGDSEFYSAFISLNMLMWGRQEDRDLIEKKFAANLSPDMRRTIDQRVAEFGLRWGLLTRTARGNEEASYEQKMGAANNTRKWEEMAKDFARTFGRSMKFKQDEPEKKPQSGQSDPNKQDGQGKDNGQKQPGEDDGAGQEGKGKKGDKEGKGDGESEDEGEGKGNKGKKPGQGEGEESDQDGEGQGKGKGRPGEGESGEEGEPSPGKHMGKFSKQSDKPATGSKEGDRVDEPETQPGQNPFDSQANTDEGKRKAIDTTLQAGKGLPKWMDPDEAIDMYYELTSRDIPIQARPSSRGQVFPAVPFGAKQFDPERDDPDMVSGIRINEDGSRGLEAYSDVFDIHAPMIERPMMHPDVCFLIDSSGSMKEGDGDETITASRDQNKRWGISSRYHFALRSVHGTRNNLRAKGILPYIKTNVIIYSDQTGSTGWQDYSQNSVGRRETVRPLFGGTQLDADVIEAQLGSKEPSVVVILSDGGITNWSTVRERVMGILSKHYVVFMKLGPDTDFSKDMESAGFKVIPIASNADLENVVIDVTDQIYRGVNTTQSLRTDWMLPK
ncbi:Uncharacterised protein [Candidatus Bilamarchaeum dharawalense]|uniref:VWFA domain-containing protein n=1 Tax=Candidatus Bilamarchaeum dharawalense TaxID=2885759 RepID=A0A5E4LPN4_9ARCH|nr:Uncharacterised protein [Candidatus Bilamarchaeum dharawalense]